MSLCGGQTLDSSAVFGSSYAYLTGKTDPYDERLGCCAMEKYYNKICEAILGFYYTGANLQYGA